MKINLLITSLRGEKFKLSLDVDQEEDTWQAIKAKIEKKIIAEVDGFEPFELEKKIKFHIYYNNKSMTNSNDLFSQTYNQTQTEIKVLVLRNTHAYDRLPRLCLKLPLASSPGLPCSASLSDIGLNDDSIKPKAIKLSQSLDKYYKYYTEANKGRWHFFSIKPENGKQGDAVKSLILNRLKDQLEACDSLSSLETTITAIKKSPDYRVLNQSQGIATNLFGFLKPSSVKAFETMCNELTSKHQPNNLRVI